MKLTEKDIIELLHNQDQSFTLRIHLITALCKLEPEEIVSEYKERCIELENAVLDDIASRIIILSIKHKICDDHYAALLFKGWNDYQIHEALGLP